MNAKSTLPCICRQPHIPIRAPSSLPSQHDVRTSPTVQTWLDSLPQKVLANIATLLQRGNSAPSADALSFAASPPTTQAVITALDNSLCVFDETETSRLQPLSAGLRELHLNRSPTTLDSFCYEMLRQPTLRKVTIMDDPQAASALLAHKSVQELTLNINLDATAPFLFALLANLPLKGLKVRCYVHSPLKNSLLHSALTDPTAGKCIPKLCPNLTYADIECVKDNNRTTFWRLFPLLTSLTKVELDCTPRKSALNQLRGIESVEILHRVKDAVYHAEQLGECITTFCTFDVLDDVDFGILQACPKLVALDICVKPEHEQLLLELVEDLSGLRKLGLTFNHHDRHSGKRRRGGLYNSLTDGMILRIVEAAPLLRELRIWGLCVAQGEMCAILRHMGNRLTKLEVTLKGHLEAVFDRFEMLVETLAAYNGMLEGLSVLETWGESELKSNLRRKGKDLAKRRRLQREQGRRLAEKIATLVRRSKWECWQELMQFVEAVLL